MNHLECEQPSLEMTNTQWNSYINLKVKEQQARRVWTLPRTVREKGRKWAHKVNKTNRLTQREKVSALIFGL